MRVRGGNLPIAVTAMLLPAAAPVPAQLDPAGNHRIFQNQVGGEIEAGDRFGEALATGDFNGDGADDLAIGAPGAFWSAAPGTGVVQILYSVSPVLFADGFELGNTSAWSWTLP